MVRQRPKKEVPTLEEFSLRFLDGHARANRQKPSGIAAKETILRVHLVPLLGAKKLDAISNEDVQWLKTQLQAKAAKTVNNVLTVLSTLLKRAVEWDVIERLPCSIRLLPIPRPKAGFHDFDDYERLVAAAEAIGGLTHLVVLLGGEAGLRCGEIMALEWSDVDLAKRQLCIQRSTWKGHVTVPKGGRLRFVPMTIRLTAALRKHRHLRGPLVVCSDDGTALTQRLYRGLSDGQLAGRTSVTVAYMCCGTRSAHTWPCGAAPHGPFRNLLGIAT
jgi:integrase